MTQDEMVMQHGLSKMKQMLDETTERITAGDIASEKEFLDRTAIAVIAAIISSKPANKTLSKSQCRAAFDAAFDMLQARRAFFRNEYYREC
jgi:hypothetical protein